MRAYHVLIAAVALMLIACSVAEAARTFRGHCRDAMTGRYVSDQYARANPASTVCERSRRRG
jgi:hypothetical protein